MSSILPSPEPNILTVAYAAFPEEPSYTEASMEHTHTDIHTQIDDDTLTRGLLDFAFFLF